ncbi:hypothetical protein [Haloechinothrix sp. LS1_15]|uniref:hypothetical protein n=1 Tax=Haloechinothrix sp. LS1_15 TaxID=2652248 RepID=UPI0029467BC6|nr:hypothetical protein [Haloechinothrix sp. LS1_15]MDV6012292.1 hypothetical protein [Haloechinothrix sp. LS1_15]
MSGDGFDVRAATLEQVSGRLAGAAQRLDSVPTAPGDVRAGEITEAVAALMAHLSSETERFMGQLGGAGEAVTASREVYRTAEDEIADALGAGGT